MKAALYLCLLLSIFALSNAQQRVAPGVPPQQYQDPMQHVPQHIPQQQMHMQQVPQQVPQMQQVPQQQYQVPQQVHHQQVPVQQQQHVQHHGQPQQHVQQHGQPHGHHPQAQILNAANIAQEKQHIQDHMEVPIDTSKMTDQELQFHYFKMHDADNNNKLDGCELIKSLIHWHEQDTADAGHSHEDAHQPPPPSHTDSALEEMVDPILLEMDQNGDGYIEWHEYKSANQ